MLEEQSHIEAQGKAWQVPSQKKERAFHLEGTEEAKAWSEKLHGLLVEALGSLAWEAWGHIRGCNELKVQESVVWPD